MSRNAPPDALRSLWRLHPNVQHLPAVPDDGFDDTSSDNRLIQGSVARCVDGVWSTGDGTKLTPDMQWIALGTAEAIQRWKNNKPVETIKKTPGVPLPDVEGLNAKIPQSEWEMGLDRKPRAPYQHQYLVYLLNPNDASLITYIEQHVRRAEGGIGAEGQGAVDARASRRACRADRDFRQQAYTHSLRHEDQTRIRRR